MPKKIALITGANKGIGFEVARQLGKCGCAVFLGARNPELGRDAASKLLKENLDVRWICLDVVQMESVREAAASIASEFDRLDILVNNAGIALPAADGSPSAASLEAVQMTVQTNFLGALAVTQALLPLLRKAPAGRIVNVSSDLGSITLSRDPNWKFASVKLIGYSASKAAMNMLTVQLAFELRDTAIKVNSANPGFTATDLSGHRGDQTPEQGAAELVRLSLLQADGPTGGFFEAGCSLPW